MAWVKYNGTETVQVESIELVPGRVFELSEGAAEALTKDRDDCVLVDGPQEAPVVKPRKKGEGKETE